MKKVYWTVMTALLVLVLGCNKSTPGGGTGDSGAKKPSDAKEKLGNILGSPKEGEFTLKAEGEWMAKAIKQGETKDIEVKITRGKNFDQDVKLSFEGLPKGVSVDPASPVIKHDENSVHVKVKVADDAALDKHEVTIIGHPEKGSDCPDKITLNIKKK